MVSGLLAVVAVCVWSISMPAPAIGGPESPAHSAHALETHLADLRAEQVVRSRRTDILREQLSILQSAMDSADERAMERYRIARDELIALLLDTRRAEEEIALSMTQLWDAQGYAQSASRRSTGENIQVVFDWPVEPLLGISAHFDDAGYRARFGFAHNAIDIPVNQGSTVRSVADGVVEKISDQGMGFNSIVVRHDGGYATLYGHVSEFLVREGEEIAIGDPIARSGGMPGTPGAGRITTGPHLHLEMFKDGKHVDPLLILPER